MNKRAFTIVELLAAMALSVTLMVAVLQSLGSVKVDQSLTDRLNADVQEDGLVELVTYDLTHARTIKRRVRNIILVGYNSLDPRKLAAAGTTLDSAQHQPVEVHYILRQHEGKQWLIRQQIPMDQLSNSNRWSELVACNVKRFQIQSAEKSKNSDQESEKIPSSVRLIVELEQGYGKTIDQVIVLN